MANAVVVPDYLKKFMAEQNGISSDEDAMASASISVPRISLRARKFRMHVDGDEEVLGETAHLVILAVDPGPGLMIKTYYEGIYNPDDSSPPTCSSSNGINPDGWVSTPQSNLCAACPKNIFGSAKSRSGGKAKACRDSKRLWVAKPDDIDGIVYGLGVPITSLKNLSAYGAQLKKMGAPSQSVIVQMSMTDEDYPVLEFAIAGFLDEKNFAISERRHAEQDWKAPELPNPHNQVTDQSQQSKQIEQNNDQLPSSMQDVHPASDLEATAVQSGDVDDALAKW